MEIVQIVLGIALVAQGGFAIAARRRLAERARRRKGAGAQTAHPNAWLVLGAFLAAAGAVTVLNGSS